MLRPTLALVAALCAGRPAGAADATGTLAGARRPDGSPVAEAYRFRSPTPAPTGSPRGSTCGTAG
jgi:hypothetical protein